MTIIGNADTCPKCGRRNASETTVCVCGYLVGWIRWNRKVYEHALAQGWRKFECPPSTAHPGGLAFLVHENVDCVRSDCPFYPTRHRHRVDDIQQILIAEEPG